MENTGGVPVSEQVYGLVLVIRGQRVMLDRDLAGLYGVTTGRLNEQVRRNLDSFPPDFMFQLTAGEHADLKSRFAISSSGWGGRRSRPLAFTQEGVAMLSSVLKSRRARQANSAIMRAFVRFRELRARDRALLRKLSQLESCVDRHDAEIGALIDAMREEVSQPAEGRRRIGFKP